MGYVFQLAHSAYDLFWCSEMEERRQIINLVFQNVKMNGEKLEYTMDEAFELLRNLDDCTIWGGWRGSNPRQPLPQSGALPTELQPPTQYQRLVTILPNH